MAGAEFDCKESSMVKAVQGFGIKGLVNGQVTVV